MFRKGRRLHLASDLLFLDTPGNTEIKPTVINERDSAESSNPRQEFPQPANIASPAPNSPRFLGIKANQIGKDRCKANTNH
jgi:hypothetical protein